MFLGGIVGVMGVLGIVYVFNFGGKLIFVMLLVFGCVLVVNMFIIMVSEGMIFEVLVWFFMSLLLVILGVVIVFVFVLKFGFLVFKYKIFGEFKDVLFELLMDEVLSVGKFDDYVDGNLEVMSDVDKEDVMVVVVKNVD